MVEKSALSGEAGGCTPTPLHSNTITYKVAVYAPAKGADTLAVFLLHPICTLWFLQPSCQSTAGRAPWWRSGWEGGRLGAWHWARWMERWGRGRGRSRSACLTSAWRGSTSWQPGAPAPAPLLSAACQQAFPFTSIPVYKHSHLQAFPFTSIPIYKHSCWQAFLLTSIPVDKHFRLQAFPFSSISVYKHSRLQAFPFTSISVYKHFRLQAFPFTSIPVYKHFRLQAFPFTSIPVYKHSRLQEFPFTSISVYKHSRTPLCNCLWISPVDVL
jgi:hypothetical protein